jgi:hypothetical protein
MDSDAEYDGYNAFHDGTVELGLLAGESHGDCQNLASRDALQVPCWTPSKRLHFWVYSQMAAFYISGKSACSGNPGIAALMICIFSSVFYGGTPWLLSGTTPETAISSRGYPGAELVSSKLLASACLFA